MIDVFPGVFKSCRKIEAEVVSMVRHMLHGGEDSAGTIASGGTEAILLAIKAHRSVCLLVNFIVIVIRKKKVTTNENNQRQFIRQ